MHEFVLDYGHMRDNTGILIIQRMMTQRSHFLGSVLLAFLGTVLRTVILLVDQGGRFLGPFLQAVSVRVQLGENSALSRAHFIHLTQITQ